MLFVKIYFYRYFEKKYIYIEIQSEIPKLKYPQHVEELISNNLIFQRDKQHFKI